MDLYTLMGALCALIGMLSLVAVLALWIAYRREDPRGPWW